MWLIFIATSEIVWFLFWVIYLRIWILLFPLLLYPLWYFDKSEQNGRRTWEFFRTLSLWKIFSPAQFYFANRNSLNRSKSRKLFVILPNATNAPLVWFGLSGGELDPCLDMCYLLPDLLFRIPLLRDILLWSGGVSKGANAHSTVLSLLNRDRSVAYAPSNDLFNKSDLENGDVPQGPDDTLYEFCIKNHVLLVPVVVSRERERYWILDRPWVRKAQRYMMEKIGYPIPLFFFPRYFANRPPEKMHNQIGSGLDASLYEEIGALKKDFEESVKNMWKEK